jgi:hypothetical protein
MLRRLLLGALLTGLAFWYLPKVRHRDASWLRNEVGIGPSHYPGSRRGEYAYKPVWEQFEVSLREIIDRLT